MIRADGGMVYALVSKTNSRKAMWVRLPLRPLCRHVPLSGMNLKAHVGSTPTPATLHLRVSRKRDYTSLNDSLLAHNVELTSNGTIPGGTAGNDAAIM